MPAHGTSSISSSYITLTFNNTDCSASILEVNHDMRCYCLKQSYFSLKKLFETYFITFLYQPFSFVLIVCKFLHKCFILNPIYYILHITSKTANYLYITVFHFGILAEFFLLKFVTFIFCTTMNVHAILIVKLFIFIFL